MNTIVLNTLNGAVTEHDIANATSVAGRFLATNAGVMKLDSTSAESINAIVKTGGLHWGELKRKLIDTVFVAIQAAGRFGFKVHTPQASHAYSFDVRGNKVSKVVVGRGIRDNYLSFELTNSQGQDFRVDAIQVLNAGAARRRT